MKCKQMQAFLLACLLVLGTLTACGANSAQKVVSRELGIDASGGREISTYDTHGGFHGDGTSCIVLQFDDDTLLKEIEGNGSWKAFPLDKTAERLVYGGNDEPFIHGEDGTPLVPPIENGYYLLIDRQRDQQTDVLMRGSFNVTVGLYDADTGALYCCEFDT